MNFGFHPGGVVPHFTTPPSRGVPMRQPVYRAFPYRAAPQQPVYRALPYRAPPQQMPWQPGAPPWRTAELERLRAQNQVLQQQAYTTQAAAQQATIAQQSVNQPPPASGSAPGVSPGSPEADLTPTQDAHENAAAAASEPAPPMHGGHIKLFLIGGVVLAAGIGGYMVLKKKKTASRA